MPRRDPDVVRITSATQSHSADIAKRQRRYVVSMSIRTVCFLLAVFFAGGVLMWIFIAASFFLPYIAVVIANGGAAPDPGGPDPVDFDPTLRALDPPPEQRPGR